MIDPGKDYGGTYPAAFAAELTKPEADYKMLLCLGMIAAGIKWLTLANQPAIRGHDRLLEVFFSLVVCVLVSWYMIDEGYHPALTIGAAIAAGLVGRPLMEALGRGLVNRAERKGQGD